MTRATKITVAATAVLAAVLLAAGCGGGSSKKSATGTVDVGAAGKVTVKLWYLGDPEAPGFQKWMNENAALYHKLHPNVTVKPTIQAVDTYVQTQTIACKSKNGPDIWYQWTGTYALENAWNGCIVPDEQVWPASDVSHLKNGEEATWKGKVWWFPQFMQVYPIVYNRGLFQKAGINPDQPPATFDELIADAQKLRAKGITPFTLGLKDGWGGEILSVSFVKQVFDNYDQLKKLVIDGNFTTDPAWKQWLEQVVKLKPYFNDDVNSLTFAQAQDRFLQGKAAMVFGTPGVQNLIRDLQAKGVQADVMEMPAFTDKRYAHSFSTNASGFAVTSWSKHADIAGDFIRFMHRPDRLSAWYRDTNTFPTDDRWDQSQATAGYQRRMLGWINENNAVYATDFEPVDLDINGNFPVFQGLLGGNMTAAQGAATYQTVIEKWRKTHPQDVQFFKEWLGANR